MSIFEITGPDGRKVEIEGKTRPTDAQLQEIWTSLPPEKSALQKGYEAVKEVPGQMLGGAPLGMSVGADIATTAATGNPYLGGLAGGAGWAGGRLIEEAYQDDPMKAAGIALSPMTGGATMPRDPMPPQGFLTGQEAKDIGRESAVTAGVGMAAAKAFTTGQALWKAGDNWMWNSLVKPVAKKVGEGVAKFGDDLLAHARKLKIRPDTVKAIKKYGYEAATNPEAAEEVAEQAWKGVAKTAKETTKKNFININPTIKKMGTILKKVKRTAGDSRVYTRLQKKLDKLSKLKNGNISWDEWTALRADLGDLYRTSDSDRFVFEIIDSLYDDAYKGGLTTIDDARTLFRESKEIKKVSTNARKLDAWNEDKVMTELNKVRSDPKRAGQVIEHLTPFIGKDAAKKAVRSAMQVGQGEAIKSGIGRGAGELAKLGALAGLGTAGVRAINERK